MNQMERNNSKVQEAPSIQAITEAYRAGIETVTGYMIHAVALLEDLYAEQDETIGQLKRVLSKNTSLRHSDFDVIFTTVLAKRRRARESLPALVEGYRVSREAFIQEIQDLFNTNMDEAGKAWPALKQRLLDGQDTCEREVVTALRQVHMEQEELSTALSGLLKRGEKVKISDLKTVAKSLSSRDSRDSAELARLLAMAEATGRDAGLSWQRLAV